MFAIMDMEWVTEGKDSEITQIAAMHVDRALNTFSTNYTRIRPSKPKGMNCFHIAYSGGTRSEFLSAPHQDEAIRTVLSWFKPDDILIWWHSEAMQMFQKLILAPGKITMKMLVINKRVKGFITDTLDKKGSPYQLLRCRGVQPSGEEHYSLNDVQVIRQLLNYLNADLEQLINLHASKKEQKLKYSSSVKKLAKVKSFLPNHTNYPYVLDEIHNTYHRNGCGCIDPRYTSLKGFGTLKGCKKSNASPCPHCLPSTNIDAAESTLNERFLYSTKSSNRIVHYRGCMVIRRISPVNLASFSTRNEAKQAGYHMCKLCNPLQLRFQQEFAEMHKIGTRRNLQFTISEDTIHITSRHDIWRIVLSDNSENLVLYHRNKYNFQSKATDTIPQFHKQEHAEKSLVGYMIYIANHDDFEDQRIAEASASSKFGKGSKPPSGRSKKGHKKIRQQERAARKREVFRVLSLIEELEAASL